MNLIKKVQALGGLRDERLVAETNKAYAVAYYIFSFGLCVDIYYGFMRAQVAFVHDLDASINLLSYVSPIEIFVFFLANIVAGVILTRKGITDTGRITQAETFPTLYYFLIALGSSLAAGFLAALMRMLAEWQVVGFDSIFWAADVVIGLVIAIMVFALTFLLSYINFLAARRRRKKILDSLTGDSVE